jgi:maleylacetate reductase
MGLGQPRTRAQALWEFTGSLGAPRSLRQLGMTDADVDRAAALATKDPYANPAAVMRDAVRVLLRAAIDGRSPPSIHPAREQL